MKTFTDDDIFNREQLAYQLSRIIDKRGDYAENETLVIALDSGWGTGKTTFIEKWSAKIKEDATNQLVNYNAWNDDGFNDPLISILSKICETFKDESNNKEILEQIKYCAGKISLLVAKGVGKKFLKEKMAVDLDEIKKVVDSSIGTSTGDVASIISSASTSSVFDEYEAYTTLRIKLRNLLMEISKEKPLIFVIDELDRCKPTYAIETLETIKHFFNIETVTFVLAIDLEQLSHSIATIYGQNMDLDGLH